MLSSANESISDSFFCASVPLGFTTIESSSLDLFFPDKKFKKLNQTKSNFRLLFEVKIEWR